MVIKLGKNKCSTIRSKFDRILYSKEKSNATYFFVRLKNYKATKFNLGIVFFFLKFRVDRPQNIHLEEFLLFFFHYLLINSINYSW